MPSSAAVEEPQVAPPSVPQKAKPVPAFTPRPSATRPKPQPPYAIILENDDDHTYEYVMEVLQRICGLKLEKAFELTQEIDHTGQALVWSGTLELAELKRDQIKGFGPDFYASKVVRFPLGVRIEPLPGE